MTGTIANIKECISNRQGKGRYRCKSDWCPTCSLSKNMWLTSYVEKYFEMVEQPYFVTVLLSPVKSYRQGLLDARSAIMELDRIGVECVGAFEIATQQDTKEENWTRFMKYSGYDPNKHKGVAHLHLLCKTLPKDLLRLRFPLTQQVRIDLVGVGDKWKDYSMDDNLTRISRYIRKRENHEAWWIDETYSDQLVFKAGVDGVDVLRNKDWIKAGSEWGEGFERLSKRWLKGVMGVEESDESGEKGGGWFSSKCMKGLGELTWVRDTNGQENHTNRQLEIMETIRKIHEKNHKAVSPSTVKVVKDMVDSDRENESTDDLFVMPKAEIAKKPKKPRKLTIKGLIEDYNRHHVITSGKHKGNTVDDMFKDKGYVNYLRMKSPYALQGIVKGAKPDYEIAGDE